MRRTCALAILAVLALSACHIHLDFLGTDELKEVVLVQTPARERILMLDVEGVMSSVANAMNPFNRDGDLVSAVAMRLDRAARDPRVRAVVVRLNSPGGEVTASDLIYHELRAFRERTKKPVVAMMMDVAASGGYYAAMAGDAVVALPSTLTGSIGVISMFPQVGTLMDRVGVGLVVVKSGALKDSGSPFRAMTEEERRLFQGIVDQYFDRFVGVVADGRKAAGLRPEDVRALADGRVWTAVQAKELKLVDEIGYVETAIRRALALAAIPQADVVRYTYFPKTSGSLYSLAGMEAAAAASGGGTPAALQKIADRLRAGFYYLWLPDAGAGR